MRSQTPLQDQPGLGLPRKSVPRVPSAPTAPCTCPRHRAPPRDSRYLCVGNRAHVWQQPRADAATARAGWQAAHPSRLVPLQSLLRPQAPHDVQSRQQDRPSTGTTTFSSSSLAAHKFYQNWLQNRNPLLGALISSPNTSTGSRKTGIQHPQSSHLLTPRHAALLPGDFALSQPRQLLQSHLKARAPRRALEANLDLTNASNPTDNISIHLLQLALPTRMSHFLCRPLHCTASPYLVVYPPGNLSFFLNRHLSKIHLIKRKKSLQ